MRDGHSTPPVDLSDTVDTQIVTQTNKDENTETDQILPYYFFIALRETFALVGSVYISNLLIFRQR